MALAKRPFWMHQVVEYVLGLVLISQALQNPDPTVPAVLGGAIVVNAASTPGALSAFRVVPRRVHRLVDVVLIGALVVFAVQPWIGVDEGVRVVMIALAAVLGFIWWQSDFTDKQRRPPVNSDGGKSTEIGRLAGRAVGGGVNAVKRRTKR